MGFSWTVASTLVASLAASLILVPVLLLTVSGRNAPSEAAKRNSGWFVSVSRGYSQVVSRSLGHPALVLGLASLFAAGGMLSARGLTFVSGADTDIRYIQVYMVLAPGTSKEATAARAEPIEARLQTVEGVEGVYTEVQGNQARFTVSVLRYGKHKRAPQEIVQQIQGMLKDEKGSQFHVAPLGQTGGESNLSLNLQGPSTELLMSLQDNIRKVLEQTKGVKDVMVRQSNPSPVLEFPVNHALAGFSGVSAADLANHLRGHLTGPVAAKIVEDEGLTYVRVKALRQPGEGLDAAAHGVIPNERGDMVPFMELVTPSARVAATELHRENRRPALKMTLLLEEGNLMAVADRVSLLLQRQLRGSGCDYSFGDEIKDIVRTWREMLSAALIGLALIYVVLIIATESLLQPLVIMSAAPIGLAGAALVLRLFDVHVSLPVYVGLMILCGLIVNVNVVLIYTINRLVREGVGLQEAVVKGTEMRFRPVVMTVLTTVCASMPMLLDQGAGASVWSPFALTLGAGLVSGSAFSLILTPTLYRCTAMLNSRLRRRRTT